MLRSLSKMGVLDTKDELKERVKAGFLSTRRSPLSPQQILGVGDPSTVLGVGT